MSDLIAVVFDSRERASEVRQEFVQMQREHLVELEDCVVAYKGPNGKIKLDQTVNLTAGGAASGGFWGLLIGLIFSIPFGGPLLPLFTAVFGASFGALSGALSDYGIEDGMMKELTADLDDGKAALFVLVRKATIDKVLEHLHRFQGKVLKTSLSNELEGKLQQVLDKADEDPA
ncbi:MAG: DUF1269 domain-containing protein [Myxococcota bacterium]